MLKVDMPKTPPQAIAVEILSGIGQHRRHLSRSDVQTAETVPEDEWTPEMHAIKQAEQSEMLLPWDRRGFFRKSLS